MTSLDTLVGRHARFEEIEAYLHRARQGSGCLVLVSGEADSGKTRFAEEAVELAERTGVAGWVGRRVQRWQSMNKVQVRPALDLIAPWGGDLIILHNP